MNHAISGEILVQEVRFPRSEIFLATLPDILKNPIELSRKNDEDYV